MTAATDVRQRALVARGVDGWLVGWFAVGVWAALWIAQRSGTQIARLDGVLYWLAIATSAMHFGISYHLAYENPRSAWRHRPISLFVLPCVLVITLIVAVAMTLAAGDDAVRALIDILLTLVYLLTIWHYIKQTYGVARLGAAYSDIRLTSGEISVLRYGLYPLWWMSVARLLTRGTALHFAGYRVGAEILPHGVYTVARVVALACAAAIALLFVRVEHRAGRLPSMMLAPYVAAFVWLALPPSYVSAGLLLAAFHALQYLSCAHRAEVAVVRKAAQRLNTARWLEIFGGAMCGGLLLSTWMPGLLNNALLSSDRPLLFSAVFFVFLNLHHYVVDAVIWRSRGELVRTMVA